MKYIKEIFCGIKIMRGSINNRITLPSIPAMALIMFLAIALHSSPVSGCAWWGGADDDGDTGVSDSPMPADSPTAGSTECCEPVDVATGNFVYSKRDLYVPSPGIPVEIGRTYNNRDRRTGLLGWGWSFSLDMRVIFTSDYGSEITQAVVKTPKGKRNIYTRGAGDTFDPPGDVFNTLTMNPDGTAQITTKDNLTYNFNQGGRLAEIKDLNGNTLTINYTDDTSPVAEITSIVDSAGREYIFTYESGKISTITDPAGRMVTYTYNGDFLVYVTNTVNEQTEYGYDTIKKNLLTIKNPEKTVILTNTYDARGRIETQDYAGKQYDFTYNDATNYTDVTEDGLYTTRYYYNDYTWLVTKTVNALNKETIYEWDIANETLTKITDPLGGETSFTYNTNGNILTVTQKISDAETKITTYAYYDNAFFNKLHTITDPEGNVTTLTYTADGKANLYSIEGPLGNITYFEEYNAWGEVKTIKDANEKYTFITYDPYGNIESIKDPLGRTTYFTHDIVGNLTQVKDALNRTTDYIYENYTRLDYTIDALGNITDYDYDANGNIKTVTDAEGHDTHFEYNEINQVRFVKDHFLNIKAEYIYYDNKNLWKVINARGETIEYTYNELYNVETKTLTGAYGADEVNYTYDDAGRLETINNTSANLTLGYDEAHRLTSVTAGGAMPAATISYEYYKNNRRKKMTDIMGVTDYTPPTELDPVETIVSPNMGTFTISYDNLNRRETLTMGNGVTATYSYDDASQLSGLVFKDGANPITSNEYPLYDDVGNRKTEIDPEGEHNYTYDEIYRLRTATHPASNPDEFLNYDLVGNRTDSHLSASYVTNELNRLTEDDNYLYGYDADGNLTSKEDKSTGDITYFYYDAENKLVRVEEYDSTPALISASIYSYDGFGRRVKKDVDGVTTYFIYDNEDIRFETDDSGAITAEYTHGPGIDEPLAMRRGEANYYYHVNGSGSITALTDSSKAVVQSYVYDSFGQIISQTGSITNPYTYTGREYDPETGMYYYRARYYNAWMGRFISEDPIGFAGGDVNLYAYVGNNPVNFVDSLGLAVFPPDYYKFRPAGGWPPRIGSKKCLKCDWDGFLGCVGFDYKCSICGATRGKDKEACLECAANTAGKALDCANCRIVEPDECGNCP